MAELREMLVYLRKRKNMSQQELADKIGVSRSTIGMYETGKREPEIEILQKLSDLYGVSMNTLIGIGYPDPWGNFDENLSPAELLRIEYVLFNSQSSNGEAQKETAAPKGDGLSPLEAQLMEYIRRLTDDQKKMLLAQIELLLSKQGSRPDSRE